MSRFTGEAKMTTPTVRQTVFDLASRSELEDYAKYVLYCIDYSDRESIIEFGEFLELEKRTKSWSQHSDRHYTKSHLAINVKFYGQCEDSEPYKSLSDAAKESLHEAFNSMWWEDASFIADEYGFVVWSEGRSGGWLILGRTISSRRPSEPIDFDREEAWWEYLADYGEHDFNNLADCVDALVAHFKGVAESFKEFASANTDIES
jgi:hypothetical protein